MSEWKPPADAVPSKNSGWKPPPDAIPAEPSFQSSLRPAEYPLTSGAAGGGSMLSATGSAGSVAAPSPSPEPQGPPSLPALDPQQDRTRKRSEALRAWSNLLDVERQAKERHAQAMTKEVAYSDLGMRGKVGTQSDELRQAGNAILVTEAAKKKLGATFDSMLDEIAREEVDRDLSRFIKKGDLGQDEINAFAVRDAVDAIAKQYGLTTLNTYRDQGGLAVTSQTNEDIASTLRNKITSLAQANIYLPKVKAIVEPKISELTGKVWDKFTTDEVEFAKAKQVILSERSSVERAMEQEAELLNEQVAQKSAAIKAEWQSYQGQLAQQAQQVNDLFQSGEINEQQANERLTSLNADQEARLAQVNGMLDQELALVSKNIANINRKHNGQFSARQDQIIAAAEANIKKSAEEYMQKFPSTPEGKAMALEARRIEKEAWEEVIKKDAQARDALAKADEELGLGPNAIPSLLRQAYKSTATSLGGSLKGWASALNSADLYALGDVMERAYLRVAPPSKEELASTSWTDKLKKSLQPVEFAKNTGELLGGMAISLAAGAAAGVATSGIGVAPALAASGTAAWGAETMDMAGRARDAMLKKTGDNEKADKAFWDTVDSQVDLSWTYALGGLPFVKGSLKFIPTKAGRVAAGALAEYGEEVLQEVPQNIAERNIAEGRDPWEGFLDELRASMQSGELSNTLVKMLPVAALGAGGQIMESGESTEKQAAKIAASLGTKSEIGRLISGSANEWAGRLAATNGERTAKAVISSMYTSGAIDDKQMLALNQAIEKYLKARKEAFDLGVPSMYRGAYADLMMQHDDLMQQIEAEGSDIAKSALKARASEVKKAAIAIADGLPDYIQVKHPDGSINTLSVWDAERLFHDKRFLQATALAGMGVGGIHVSYMGVDAKALDALASFQERAAQELLRIKAEATSRRNSAVSPPVSVEAPNVADDRKAIMAKTKEALRKMVADFQSQRATGQLGGSAVIESKEALNTQPKDEVDAILDEEFAEEPEADVSGGLAEIPAPAPEAATVVETPQGTGVEVEVGPTGAVTPEAISATRSVVETPAEAPTGATAPPQPVAQKAKPGKKDAAQAAPAAPTAEPVTSITEVKKSKDGSQVEYKVPGWEDLRIVVQREKGGYAANIMVGDQALKIQPKGKEQGTAKLAILDAKERLDRAGREKISALISSATPSAQRPQDGIAPSETAIDRIENVVKALRSIVPDLAVIVHDTPEEFAAESRRAGGRGIASDAAFYDPKTNAIHLNRQMASDNTLFHEAAHPILLAVLQNNPELFLSLYEQLAKDPAFDKYIKFGESYSDKDELTRAAESLAEFMADVAAGKVQFSNEPGSLWQKFVEWLQELMAKVGLDFRAIDLSNPQNVRDFAAKFARGVREGIELKGLAEVRRSDALPMLQEDAQAVVDGWYSRLDQAVAAKGSTMPGPQWGKWLEARAKEGALSLEEAKWTGLNDFLASKGNEKVTPQQVREFLKENRVKVEVVEKGDTMEAGTKRYRELMARVQAGEDLSPREDAELNQLANIESPTKFGQHQLPGASNYREVLVTLPPKNVVTGEFEAAEIAKSEQRIRVINENKDHILSKYPVISERPADVQRELDQLRESEQLQIDKINALKRGRNPSNFRSSHFDEPNILVHLRLNDRTGPNGEKILFIEELQSDWGQEGKKKGFGPPPSDKETAAALMSGRALDRKTPPAPFVTSTDAWVELGLKQAIRMAAEGGYDKIAWSTGEQQFNRWGSQAFAWSKGKTGWRIIGKEQIGGEAFAGMEEALAQEAKESDTIITSKEELRDVVEGVMGRERSDYSTEKWKTHINKIVDGMWERMQNEDSGTTMPRREGMKGFYDKILPTAAKKVSKRLGGDGVVSDAVIGEDIQVGDRIGRQQSISITPEMRQRVSAGVPLMQRPKAIPVDRWNAMVPTIREALKSGATPEQVMEQIGDLAKGLDQSQKGAIQGKIQQVYDKIETMRKKDQIVDKRISEDDSKKLADAEKLRKSIKKGLKKGAQKRRDVYLNELAKDFTSLRIPKTALDDYINMATAIKDLIRGAGVSVTDASVDALRTDAGVTNEQIEQYIQQQQQAQQALDEQEMLEEFEQKRIEMGLEGASLTLDDIRSLMNSFAAEEQQQEALEAKMKAEQKLQMLRTMSRLKLEELSEHLKSQELDKDKKRIVANLKLIDLDRLSAKDAVFLIGMVNNIVKNDRWGGARTFSEEVGSSERAIALMQEFAAMRKKLPKPKAARNATEQVVMMMRRFFGEYSDKIAEASGMDGILNASAQANRVAEEIHKARDKYAKSVGYKDTELNRYRAQAYAYLQSVEGDTQEQQQASFEKLRNDLLESARMLMDPTRDTHRVKFPDLYIQAVAEVAEPARSLGDVKVAEPIRKMVEWEQQQHAKDYAMHAQAAELDHNKRMGYVRAYTARGYFETDRFTETQQNRDPSVLERFFDGTTVKERLAGSKMDRVGRRPSQIVDLDFFSVQDSARRELYMDTFGARYIARMRGVLTDPRLFEGDNPVMTRATRDIMTQRVRSLIKADQVVADVFSDKWTKAYNKVSRRASAIALVGTGAFIKQLTPLVSTFFHVRPSELVQGMRDAMETHREGTWQNNIAKTQTIYERAQVMAGLERIGETVARKAVLRGDENRAMELSKLLYTEAGHLSNELGRRTIALGDAWAATATWWAFYRQYIRKAGLENTNWKAELNEQAAAYASDREQFMQGANIPEANAPMYRNVKLPMRVVLDIFFSFNSFNLNNLNRMSHDIKDIRFGSPEARKRGYIDLAARLFEMAAFRATTDALRIYATLFLADLILEAIGDDPEDDRARRADADAKKYDYWVRLLADVGMDFVFTGMGDIPINVVKDGFNTIVNLAEKDTGPKKRNYNLYYVSDKDSYGVLGILYGQASNLAKAAEVMSMYKGVEGKEAKRMRDEAMILAALSVAHLAGYTDQTITRGLEREIVRRLPYQVMHKREERFGQVLGRALYDMIDQDEPYTPSDTYEND